MDFLSCWLPDSTNLPPLPWHIAPDRATAALTLISQQPAPGCPLCHVAARRLHSHYERTLADLSWAGWTVRLELGVRKLFRDNPDCRASSPPEHAGRCGSASASPPSPSAVPPAPGSAGNSASRPRATRCCG